MTDLTIDDVRKYVEENGPKRVNDGVLNYLAGKTVELVLKVRKEKRVGWCRNDIPTRIQEMLPAEGQISLSGRNGKVIIYDADSQSYREAVLDTVRGQPIPTQKRFELDGHKPLSSLEIVHFSRFSGETANFLERALELFDAPVIEIGKHVGDTFNRYFSMKKYAR